MQTPVESLCASHRRMPSNYKYVPFGALICFIASCDFSGAFVPRTSITKGSSFKTAAPSIKSSLNMVTPPPLIIGPMIRKMREEQKKKNMPMALDEEKADESQGLRVGVGAWRWPPVWPYDDEIFLREADKTADPVAPNPMAMMLNSQMGGNELPAVETEVEEELLDSLEYWGEEKNDVRTELDEAAAENLQRHYAFYLQDGMSVLELGAAEESYLPQNLKFERHVGVGASKSSMESNPALTESMLVDLNRVVPEQGVDSEELNGLDKEQFDAIIMANTVDFLTEPREVFRTAWRLLKPGGLMMVPFVNTEAYSEKFGEAQTKMWRNYNDDQHMWVTGSFFHFSAGEGWEKLKGFDISPDDASKNSNVPLIGGLLNRNKPMNIYVVQARKALVSDTVDVNDPEKSFQEFMCLAPTLEDRDKKLVAPRMARAYMLAPSQEQKKRVQENVELLPKVYKNLIKMDQFAFPFALQAQLAVDIVGDPDFVGNDEQLEALRMGLGLSKPSESFWAPVGKLTANMVPEDKVNLLTYLVPRFGSGNPEQDAALDSFVSGLTPTFEVIRSKCPDMSEGDVQLVGSELLVAEVLIPGRSSRKEFAAWLGALTESEIEEYVAKRKSYKEVAMAEMKAMQDRRKIEEELKEEEMKAYQENIERARTERTMVFNEETGKMEEIKK